MKSSKSSLFLMELTISILFFAVASTVCIQLFVKAHLLDKKTQTQNQTVVWVQDLAELWYAYDADFSKIRERLCADYPDAGGDGSIRAADPDGSVTLCFDGDWNLSASDVIYVVSISRNTDIPDPSLGMECADITVEESSQVIYELTITRHTALKGGDVHE